MVVSPVVRADHDPDATHAYVSADPSVHERATLLPVRTRDMPSLDDLFDAVAGLCRVTDLAMYERGSPRTLFVRAARTLSTASAAEIGRRVGLGSSGVRRVPPGMDSHVRLVERIAGDGRFSALYSGDLRTQPLFHRFRCRG